MIQVWLNSRNIAEDTGDMLCETARDYCHYSPLTKQCSHYHYQQLVLRTTQKIQKDHMRPSCYRLGARPYL